jgi:hypothetical protein
MWLFSRSTLYGVSALVVAVAGFAAAQEAHWLHQTTKIEIALESGGPCKLGQPLFVMIRNHSSRPVYGVGFELRASKRGTDDNLVSSGFGRWDGIIPAGATTGVCWSYPSLRWEEDLKGSRRNAPIIRSPEKSSLEWSIELSNVSFANE